MNDISSDSREFQSLIDYIETELKFPTSHYNTEYLNRRIKSRIRPLSVESYGEYQTYLENTPSEHTALLDAFNINVTSFFRDGSVWDGVRKLLRKLSASQDCVNVWSAACADGREPYSIALLALTDPEIRSERVSITATDINKATLQKAREGEYRSSAVQDVEDELSYLGSTDYATSSDGEVAVSDEVKDLVSFEHHDIIHGEQKSGFDIVLCRNMLIYVSSEHKPDVFGQVHSALNHSGYLILGKPERIPDSLRSDFDAVVRELRIYRTCRD